MHSLLYVVIGATSAVVILYLFGRCETWVDSLSDEHIVRGTLLRVGLIRKHNHTLKASTDDHNSEPDVDGIDSDSDKADRTDPSSSPPTQQEEKRHNTNPHDYWRLGMQEQEHDIYIHSNDLDENGLVELALKPPRYYYVAPNKQEGEKEVFPPKLVYSVEEDVQVKPYGSNPLQPNHIIDYVSSRGLANEEGETETSIVIRPLQRGSAHLAVVLVNGDGDELADPRNTDNVALFYFSIHFT